MTDTPASTADLTPAERADHAEILDRDGLDPAVVEASLAELSRVNRLLFGYRPVHRALLPRLADGPARPLVVDVGTGSGDVAASLARRASRAGGGQARRVTVVGVDRKLAHLLAGRRRGVPQLRVVADAAALPFPDAAVDWTLSTLFFHHFGAESNRRIVAEMRRVAHRGALVVDLRRNRLGEWVGRLLVPLTGAGFVTRHDGRVSLARCWRLRDVAALVADLPVRELKRRFPFRFSLLLAPARPTASAQGTPSRAVLTHRFLNVLRARLGRSSLRVAHGVRSNSGDAP